MPTLQKTVSSPATLDRIIDRAFVQMVQMVWVANHRNDKRPGDPKVGGHPASCASSKHILGALHLAVREVNDYVCCKPHASPMDHAYHHLLRLFSDVEGGWLDDETGKAAMGRLRKFAEPGAEHVFQSYHARTDPDSFHFLPTGSVGIPPVASIYLALAHRYMQDHGQDVPRDAHFWSLIGDSEFREGSLLEAMPDAAERLLGNVTWIIDYNRQNLDGTRMPNDRGLHSRDCDRIERTAVANGWQVIQVRHGAFREQLFAKRGGQVLRGLFEDELSDYEYQLVLFRRDPKLARTMVKQHSPKGHAFLEKLSDEEVMRAFEDVGGHDTAKLIAALTEAKQDPDKPCLVVAHTIKGHGMSCFADPSNHSTVPGKAELEALLGEVDLDPDDAFAHFAAGTEEAQYLEARGEKFRNGIEHHHQIRRAKRAAAREAVEAVGGLPDSFGIDLTLYPRAHTQWMWGQIAAKILRISSHGEEGPEAAGGEMKPLTPDEERWASVTDFVLTLSPDVGTSTNIAPLLDQRIYGPGEHAEAEVQEFEARHPELMTGENPWTRHIRFEIAEANCMSAAGSFGRMAHYTGNPSFPVMTVYDFFIKRALDQLYYNLYWGAEFVIMGTPSGTTLSFEGAQHSWKSDIQIPNLITWEPFFALEMDWILSDAIKRHMLGENGGRSGVLIRAVTRTVEQKLLLENLRKHAASKAELPAGVELAPTGTSGPGQDEASFVPLSDETLLAKLREDVLAGAYYLVDWRGYAGYEPGDNVINVFAMGALTTETLVATEQLLERGIFANVISISSPELLVGILGEQSSYQHLREGLSVDGDLHAVEGAGASEAGLISLAGRRVPCVAVCDGEAGLVDNIGSIVGVKQITLAVRRFSKCGRPDQVYEYQDLDPASITEACGRVLSETALESFRVSPALMERMAGRASQTKPDWRELWPQA